MKTISMTAAFFALFAWGAAAQSNNGNNSSARKQELSNAAMTVQQMSNSNKVPKSLVDQAQCIAVIPNMTQGAFIVGAKHGAGVVSCRNDGKWSAPAFISISGGSIGLQAGGSNSQILLLMNKQGEQRILNGNFQLTANAVAAGPNGSNYKASAGWKAPVLSYKQSNGAYAGATVAGSTIQVDQGSMHKVYGQNATVHQVLSGSVPVPQQAHQFVSSLPQHNANAMG
jgi:lipid-binding SYLF domain-containing protein